MTGLLELICERLLGKPLAEATWQELIRVRDDMDRALNGLVNSRQAGDVLPPGGGR